MRAQAEITLRRVEKDENRASLKEMIRAIDDSSRAAGQLLDHAMVTFRTDHLEQSQINLAALVGETADRLKAVAELKDIELTYNETGPAQIANTSFSRCSNVDTFRCTDVDKSPKLGTHKQRIHGITENVETSRLMRLRY